MKKTSYQIFSGTSHPELASEVAARLKTTVGRLQIERFPDGEIGAQILENVRDKDVFVFQSVARRPNRYLMELLILVDAFKRASARSIVAVLPYYPYARQDRKEKGRVPITAKLVANLLEKAGVTRMLTMDLHTEQIQGFFDIPVDHLFARPYLVQALKKAGFKKGVVVSPDVGSSRMARKYADALEAEIAVVDKRRVSARDVAAGAIIGDVSGRDVVLVDDIVSTGGTLEMAAKVCRKEGARRVFAAVTHGLLMGDKPLEGIDQMFVADTVPCPKTAKVTCVSVAPLFAEAVRCVVEAKSISSLFERK
ncbi:MAG: ribose-phosphate pyrophosphokinae [Chlamydiota bacterium]|jgi:ribose-phosphate pyrophosphokinase